MPHSNLKIVFDCETQKTFEEVGGRDAFHKLGISYVGVYAYSQGKFFGFWEKDLPILEKILRQEQPTLIGFNSIKFDIPVLQPYFHNFDLHTLPHIDILLEIERALGHRVKLENVAQATIFEGKTGDGLDAIRWFREGSFQKLAKYCLDDVRVTRDVYEYGCRHGKIYYPSGGERLPIPIPWSQSPTLAEILQQACVEHVQVDVEYFDIQDTGKKILITTLEIFSINENIVDAYSYAAQRKQSFFLDRFWNAQLTEKRFAHQVQLFG